ncbi:MAG: hypothetical protein ACHQ03_11895, partial [Candidatus Bathyarchaeia archaeon]
LSFDFQPQLTLQENASSINIPGTVSLFGTVVPSTDSPNITLYRNGLLFDQVYSYPVSGNFNQSVSVYSPDDAGQYRAIVTIANTNPMIMVPGNSTIASLFTSTAEVDFTAGSTGAVNFTTSGIINATTYDTGNSTSEVVNATTNFVNYTSAETVVQSTQGVPAPFSATILDPIGRPLRSVQVQLFWSTDSSSDTLFFTPISDVYHTDLNGQVIINDPRINSTMQGWGYLQVTLATDYFVVKDNSTFVSDGATSVYDLKNASFALPSNNFFTVNSAADLQKTFKMTSTQTPAWATGDPTLGDYTHMGQLAAAYVDTMNAVLFWSDNMKLNFDGYEIPVVAYSPGSSTYFQPIARPFIAIGTDNVQYLGDSPNCEYHEFAHYAMWKSFGGAGYFSSKDATGDNNHQGFYNPNSWDAWTEGWAEFWGMATWNYAHGIIDPTHFDANYTIVPGDVFNMNNVYPVNVLSADGTKYDTNAEELALSTLLWSLYSGTDDIDGKTIMLSAQNIWIILTSKYSLCTSLSVNPLTCQKTSRQIETITDLYSVLTSANNIQTYGYTKAEIDKIFTARHIYENHADGTKDIGVDNCCRYPTPSSPNIRNSRSDTPVDNGSGVVVNSDPSSLPYTLEIQINYQAPYQQDDYTVPVLITQSQQTVYLWLPPSTIYNSTADLIATNQAGRQLSLGTITGAQYYNNSETGTPLFKTAIVQFSGGGSNPPTATDDALGLVILGAIIILPVLGIALFVRRRKNRKT